MWFRRQWTNEDACGWTKEDYWAVLLSALSYVLLTVGSALVLILPLWGGLCLLLCAVFGVMLYWIIDPKLTAASAEFETKEKKYLQDLERNMKWEED